MSKLNNIEQITYDQKICSKIQDLPPGKYYISEFFGEDPSVPRIAKKLCEDVVAGVHPRVRLAGLYSRDGYILN